MKFKKAGSTSGLPAHSVFASSSVSGQAKPVQKSATLSNRNTSFHASNSSTRMMNHHLAGSQANRDPALGNTLSLGHFH